MKQFKKTETFYPTLMTHISMHTDAFIHSTQEDRDSDGEMFIQHSCYVRGGLDLSPHQAM